MIICQQQDIHKIFNRIPGHGLQEIVNIDNYQYKSIKLSCGCNLPYSYLSDKEKEVVKQYEDTKC